VRVLFLTHRLPYAPNRGDRIRAFHIIESLKGRVDLDIVSLVHDSQELAEAQRMRDEGASLVAMPVSTARNYAAAIPGLLGTRPLTHMLLHAAGLGAALRQLVRDTPPDVVLAYCSGMARFAVEPPLAQFPLVLDLVDVDSAKWSAMAETSAAPMRWVYRREARCLGVFERESGVRAACTMVVNDREAATLRALAPDARVRVVPNGIDVATFRPASAPAEAPRVVFCGVMNYAPNVEGVLWFARGVWPRIRAARPDAHFSIVGSDPVAAVRELAGTDSGIEVTGTVPDVRRYLWESAVSVAPLKTARGLQNKVLEALAAGLPVVATHQVFEGLPLDVRDACSVADSADEFADDVLALLGLSGSARRAVAGQADLSALSWAHQLAPVYEILAAAAAVK
jgi:sugar transferase (PEP-CTERM/EpsH1 system associated)